MTTNAFVVKEDVYGHRPDGRTYLIAAKGTTILDSQAIALGLLVRNAPRRPTETKVERVQPPLNDEVPEIVKATPGALALAKEHELDLDVIEGSGKDGRVTKGDVEAALD